MYREEKGFSIAEALITLMIVSLILAAVLPVVSKKSKTSDTIWHYVSNGVGANSDVYYGASNSQSAIIGNTSAPDSSKGSRLVIVTPEDSSGDTIQRSLIDFYQKTSTGMTNIGKIGLDTHANISIGVNSLKKNEYKGDIYTSEPRSTFYKATNNTAVGHNSLLSNSSGVSNSAFGAYSMRDNTSGSWNLALGTESLLMNTVGSGNVSVGAHSMYFSTEGYNNTAIGIRALAGYEPANTRTTPQTGSQNVAVGASSLYLNTTGSNNVANGANALYSNTTGNYLTAIGMGALSGNKEGIEHTAVGYFALSKNTSTGYESNTAMGYHSLGENTTGTGNTAFGDDSLGLNQEGIRNTGVGHNALYSNKTSQNTAVGYNSQQFTSSGAGNTSIGARSMAANIDGYENVAVGHGSLRDNLNGYRNVAVGQDSLLVSTTGYLNTAVGDDALFSNTTGSGNTGIGKSALRENTTGSNNVALGQHAGFGVNDSNKLYIEGNGYYYTGSSALIYGDFFARSVKINGSLTVNSFTNLSDKRIKNIKEENKIGLERILKLKVYDYTFRNTVNDKRKHTGILAQDLQKIIPNAVVEGPGNDKYKSLLYIDSNEILFTCVNAIKQLYAKNLDVNNKIKSLEHENSIQKKELARQAIEIQALCEKYSQLESKIR